MKKEIFTTPIAPDESTISATIDLPTKCPHCGIAYANGPLSTHHFSSHYQQLDLYSIYFCPHCARCFFVCYYVSVDMFGKRYGHIRLVYPAPDTLSEFPDAIKKLSPKFVEIYQQAESAENNGLSEICGLGYRKALEFLIKDYAIYLHPNNEDTIKSKLLAKCISDHIDSQRIKTLATASAWIGNDETHYVRKHEDYDISHLKKFINAVVSYIDSELSVEEAFSLLSK